VASSQSAQQLMAFGVRHTVCSANSADTTRRTAPAAAVQPTLPRQHQHQAAMGPDLMCWYY
jgi:hypothetical protein